MEKEKIEKIKTAGIVLGTFIITLGLIGSIGMINFIHAKEQQYVIKLPKSKSKITLVEHNDSIKVDSKLKTYVCEVVDVPNKQNDERYQMVCDDSGKYGFTEKEIVNKKTSPAIKIGDHVNLTEYEDGNLMVSIRND